MLNKEQNVQVSDAETSSAQAPQKHHSIPNACNKKILLLRKVFMHTIQVVY